MSTSFSVMADVSIDASTTFMTSPLPFKGKGALTFSCDTEGLIIRVVYTPIHVPERLYTGGRVKYLLDVPPFIVHDSNADPAVHIPNSWVKPIDLPEGTLQIEVDTSSDPAPILITFYNK